MFRFNIKKYFVYVLLSLKDGKFYIGFTSDLNRRLKEHNAVRLNQQKIADHLNSFTRKLILIRPMQKIEMFFYLY